MKRKISLVIFGFFVLLSAEAQKEGDKILFAGFGLGASVSSYDYASGADVGAALFGEPRLWNDEDGGDSQLSYNIGVMFDFFLMDKLALTFGLGYDNTPLSYKYPKRLAAYDLELEVDSAFLTIPAGVHYYFFDHLIFGGGFYLGIPIKDDCETKIGPDTGSGSLSLNNDIGLFFDLGYNFTITNRHNILLSMRYKHGLSKIYSDDDIITDIKLRTLYIFQLAYGYKF